MARTRDRYKATGPFLAWMAAGALLGVALAGVATIGLLILPLAVVAVTALVLWPKGRNASAFGVLAGLGAVPLYIAYLNRGGPGTVCTTTATGGGCSGEWSPWPFLAAGVLLIGAGAALFWLLRWRHAR